MSCAIDGFNITLTRGDALSVRLPLSLDGNEYVLQPGDVVRFALNTADHEDEPILTKVLDGYVLTNGETYSTVVYLGINDSPENWREIPESEVPDDAEGMG